MKKLYGLTAGVAVMMALSAGSTFAQLSSREAKAWFEIGVAEKDPQKKIAAYHNALAEDPNFVEALYNIGVVYKKRQEYAQAEKYFLRALTVGPQRLQSETKAQVLYELGMTYFRQSKNDVAEEYLRGAQGVTNDPATGQVIQLELGRVLTARGRFSEALTELRSGQATAGARANEYEALIAATETELELQQLYNSAQAAKSAGNLAQAQAGFAQIQSKKANYKDVAQILASLESAITAEGKQQAVAVLFEQAQKYEAAANLEMAVATYESVLLQNGDYKDARTRLLNARQQLEQRRLTDKLEDDYAAALTALRAQDWTRAIIGFEKILDADRNYRDARVRLTEAQRALDRESSETIAARYYADGAAAMKRNDWNAALAAFEKVRRINPRYRDLATLLQQAEAALAQTAVPAPPSTATPNALADSLYRAASVAAENKDWMQALVTLEKLQLLQPNYREVVDRLAEARAHVQTAQVEIAPDAQAHAPFGGGMLAILLTVPAALGLVAFSPAMRARLCLLRSDYAGAVAIYERMLTRRPTQLKFYPRLAGLYLLLGRTDDSAMKIFKTILQLNLTTRNRDEINSIVAQHMLAEGRTDSDAISVLESALQAEQKKRNLY